MDTPDLRGTIYIAPDGTVYQLDDYISDWASWTNGGEKPPKKPSYVVMLNRASAGRSGFSRVSELPTGTFVAWAPAGEAERNG